MYQCFGSLLNEYNTVSINFKRMVDNINVSPCKFNWITQTKKIKKLKMQSKEEKNIQKKKFGIESTIFNFDNKEKKKIQQYSTRVHILYS